MSFHTEFEFTLPQGYVDSSGTVHKAGVMRLATAMDEIFPMRDPRVQGNPGYLAVILFSRVIVRLGSLPLVDTGVIEKLHPDDMAFLERLYERINGLEDEHSHDSSCGGQCSCGH